MPKPKRNAWEELLEIGRRIVKEVDDLIEDLLDPKARQPREPARAPVPVPIPPNPPNPKEQAPRAL